MSLKELILKKWHCSDYDDRIGIVIRNEADNKIFTKFLHRNNFKWITGRTYIDFIYDSNKKIQELLEDEVIVIYFSDGVYGYAHSERDDMWLIYTEKEKLYEFKEIMAKTEKSKILKR